MYSLRYYNHVTRQTYTTQKQVNRRGLLDSQKQENRRKEDRTQEIQRKAPQARRIQRGQEIILRNMGKEGSMK